MKLVEDLLDNNDMTQTDLANKIGLDHSTISCYILGKRKPKNKILKLMALALKYEGNPEDLFNEVLI